MLRPKKKITKKELKHDPLLDTLEKGKEYFEENSKQIVTVLSVVVIIFLLSWGWMNNRASTKNEAMLANTKITIAAMQGLDANVLSELEMIVEEYGNREEIAQSTLQLGIARMDSGDYSGARKLFTRLARRSDKHLKAAGKLKLANLSEKEADYATAASIYQEVAKLDLGAASDYASLQAGYAFLMAGNVEKARNIATELLNDDPTGNFRAQVKYFEGKVLEK